MIRQARFHPGDERLMTLVVLHRLTAPPVARPLRLRALVAAPVGIPMKLPADGAPASAKPPRNLRLAHPQFRQGADLVPFFLGQLPVMVSHGSPAFGLG